jgi:hypothetical protein
MEDKKNERRHTDDSSRRNSSKEDGSNVDPMEINKQTKAKKVNSILKNEMMKPLPQQSALMTS